MFLFTLLFSLVGLFYAYIKYRHGYWSRRNIPTLKPIFFFGNIWDTLLGRKNLFEPITEAYNKLKDYKYVGYYKCITPSLIINDPEIIGNILVKDFTHFQDNDLFIDEKRDILMARDLFALKGQEWKTKKSLLSPIFTSCKMKNMFNLIRNSSETMVAFMKKEVEAGRNKCVDGKLLAWRYTTDNVANCAFGQEAHSFETDSEFVRIVKQFGSPSIMNALKLNIVFMLPTLGNFLSFSFFDKNIQDYLFNIVQSTISYRKENKVVRNDFLDMLSQLKDKSTEVKFDDYDVTAHAAGFFGDGIDTSAVVISYCLFEIASHRNVQDRLRLEIADVKSKYDDKTTYEAVNEMTYLECVLNGSIDKVNVIQDNNNKFYCLEVLRLYPPFMVLLKTCTKTYEFPPTRMGTPGVTLHPGDSVLVPVEGLHRDPDYFPEPEIFDPMRFAKENKSAIRNYTYLPFGEGPRYCVGMRFVVLQVKVALIAFIENFEVQVNGKMKVPLELDPGTIVRMPLGGFWFNFFPVHNQH